MTALPHRAYDGPVDVFRFRALRWITAGLGVLIACLVGTNVPAGASSSALETADQPVINVIVRGRGNELTVRVWDRSTVQVDYADEAPPAIDRHTVPFGSVRFPLAQQIPPQLYSVRDRDGATSAGAFPPEEFPFAAFRSGAHDVIRIEAPEGSRLTVTVPASTGILALRIGGGRTNIEGYRGANLFLIQGQGRVQLTGATTSAFVQMNYGTFYAADGTFDRIRVRGIGAQDIFERCRTKQIEAASIIGSIVYDGGSFDPGLARFESQSGNIALGVTSAAQLTGRSQDGHVYTQFDRRGGATVEQRGDGEAIATVGAGGALVNAMSARGNVYFYEGSLAGRRVQGAEWHQLNAMFNLHRRAANPARGRAEKQHQPHGTPGGR
jgi:hypothetical protein